MNYYNLPQIDDVLIPKYDYSPDQPEKKLYQDFVFWDIETTERYEGKNVKLDFDMCVLKVVRMFNEKNFKILSEFRTLNIDDFKSAVKTIISRNYKTVFIAHNTGFDIRYSKLLPMMKAWQFKIDLYYETMSTFLCCLHNDDHRVLFIDSMNWFSTKLGNLAKLVNMDKNLDDMTSQDRKVKLEYCGNDVDILIAVFDRYKKFLWNNFHVNMKLTRGSDAFNIFRRTLPKETIFKHNFDRLYQQELASYYGGRTECFKLGKLDNRNWYKIDVNSLYPSVMSTETYPVKHEHCYVNVSVDKTRRLLEHKTGLAFLDTTISEPAIPVKIKESHYYPIGKIQGFYCGKELEWILNNGYKTKIHELNVYSVAPIFHNVILELNRLKEKASKENNLIDRTNIKLLMNSIYGKFAQRNEQLEYSRDASENDCYDTYEVDDDGNQYLTERILNSQIYSVCSNILSAYSFPLIASTVTANSRQKLWTAIQQCGIENIAYVDTDSIITNNIGLRNMSGQFSNTVMGKWKNEGMSREVEIRGLKDYTFDGKDTIKGVPKSAKRLTNELYEFDRIGSLKQTKAGTKDTDTDIRKVSMRLDRKYKKAILDPKFGYSPFNIDKSNWFSQS